MTIPDLRARQRVLTDLKATLLVEAAAGTGKTSLLAGRVAMLLASGCLPSSIAALTFTELAAGELDRKIRATVTTLADGNVPPALKGLLPEAGLNETERVRLRDAVPRLDELSAMTIHGFCQAVIRAHGVAAGLDPGARVIDGPAADRLFEETLSTFLAERLGANGRTDAPLAVLAKDDPLGIVELIRELAELRRDHRTARTVAPDPSKRHDLDFIQAVDDFARWHSAGAIDPWTADLIGDLERLAGFFTNSLAGMPDFPSLWPFTKPPRIPIMRKKSLQFAGYHRIGAWKEMHGDVIGSARAAEAGQHFARVDGAYRALLGHIAEELVDNLSKDLDGLIEGYGIRKRRAAVLDFDDLLHFTRDLVTKHEAIRVEVGRRFEHLLVDEFQDTDRLQAEILFTIAASERPERWEDARLRPGHLFLVGDPKQAIYRFRGADIEAYQRAHDIVRKQDNGAVLTVTANFRSRTGIIEHVNDSFGGIFSQADQPEHVAIHATADGGDTGLAHIARLTVVSEGDTSAEALREAEAEAVAAVCKRMIGAVMVRREKEAPTPLRAGDIALLAPTSKDLWRYERALVRNGLAVASQAGKALFTRQETQDLLALCRTLSDPFDTLAFGALMRGPLVGISDEELLDIAMAMPANDDGQRKRFTVTSNLSEVSHPIARSVLSHLQDLRRMVGRMTPAQLLATAVERMQIRVVLAVRHGSRNAPSLANIDAIIERARPYGVTGLRSFVRDFQDGWKTQALAQEGRVDSSEDSIELITMHSAKGLEWPVVIPVNSSTRLRSDKQFVYHRSHDTLHWTLSGIASPELARAREIETRHMARERERLWYVACTRARDLLILPHLPNAHEQSWSRVMDLRQSHLEEFDSTKLPRPNVKPSTTSINEQSPIVFAEEAERVRAAAPRIEWRNPSAHDPDRANDFAEPFVATEGEPETGVPVGAGALRGVVLHKLMEEFLTGELTEEQDAARQRAAILLEQLIADRPVANLPEPDELGDTALKTLRLPAIAELRGELLPELAIWGHLDNVAISARGDALVVRSGKAAAVIDWKSDARPDAMHHAQHVGQVRDYMRLVGAPRGALVYMTTGRIEWLDEASVPTD